METPARQNEAKVPADPGSVDKTRRRPVRAIGLLLILQVIGLAGIGFYEFTEVDWPQIDPDDPPQEALEAVALFLFVPPAILAFLAALGFLLLTRRGWLLAAIAEGLSLAACLWLYTELNPIYIYPIMVYCILMILYLNSQPVRMVFHPGQVPAKRSPEATRGS